MDRNIRRRIRRLKVEWNNAAENFPHVQENNPTHEQELEQARYLYSHKRFHRLLRHLPRIRKKIDKTTAKLLAKYDQD